MDRPTNTGQVDASKTPSTQRASAMYIVQGAAVSLSSSFFSLLTSCSTPWSLKVLEVDQRDDLSEISSTNTRNVFSYLCLSFCGKKRLFLDWIFIFSLACCCCFLCSLLLFLWCCCCCKPPHQMQKISESTSVQVEPLWEVNWASPQRWFVLR